MKERILAYVKERRAVSFVELQNMLGEAAVGDYALCMGSNQNMVLWSGMSEEFLDAVEALLHEGALVMKPTVPLVYLADGGFCRLPLAKGKYHYRKPHWVPVVLDVATDGQVRGAHNE